MSKPTRSIPETLAILGARATSRDRERNTYAEEANRLERLAAEATASARLAGEAAREERMRLRDVLGCVFAKERGVRWVEHKVLLFAMATFGSAYIERTNPGTKRQTFAIRGTVVVDEKQSFVGKSVSGMGVAKAMAELMLAPYTADGRAKALGLVLSPGDRRLVLSALSVVPACTASANGVMVRWEVRLGGVTLWGISAGELGDDAKRPFRLVDRASEADKIAGRPEWREPVLKAFVRCIARPRPSPPEAYR